MEKGVVNNKKRFLTLGVALLVFGIITMSLIYRGSLTSRITGAAVKEESKTISESEAANRLIEYLNLKYGDARFFRSEDLGSIYKIVVGHGKETYDCYMTKDGKYFSNAMEKIEVQKNNTDYTTNKTK